MYALILGLELDVHDEASSHTHKVIVFVPVRAAVVILPIAKEGVIDDKDGGPLFRGHCTDTFGP